MKNSWLILAALLMGCPEEETDTGMESESEEMESDSESEQDTGPVEDADNDGVTEAEGDCDDNDPLIFPGAEEDCSSIDRNCDDDPYNGTLTLQTTTAYTGENLDEVHSISQYTIDQALNIQQWNHDELSGPDFRTIDFKRFGADGVTLANYAEYELIETANDNHWIVTDFEGDGTRLSFTRFRRFLVSGELHRIDYNDANNNPGTTRGWNYNVDGNITKMTVYGLLSLTFNFSEDAATNTWAANARYWSGNSWVYAHYRHTYDENNRVVLMESWNDGDGYNEDNNKTSTAFERDENQVLEAIEVTATNGAVTRYEYTRSDAGVERDTYINGSETASGRSFSEVTCLPAPEEVEEPEEAAARVGFAPHPTAELEPRPLLPESLAGQRL